MVKTTKPMNIGLQRHIIKKQMKSLGLEDKGYDIEAQLDRIDPDAHLQENLDNMFWYGSDDTGDVKLEIALQCHETTDDYEAILATSNCGKNPIAPKCPSRKTLKEACRCGSKPACTNLKKFDKQTKKPDYLSAAKKRLKKSQTKKAKVKVGKSSIPSGGSKISTPPPIKTKEVKRVVKKSTKRTKAVKKVQKKRTKIAGRVSVKAHTRGRPKRS